jgi:hypothetical protein
MNGRTIKASWFTIQSPEQRIEAKQHKYTEILLSEYMHQTRNVVAYCWELRCLQSFSIDYKEHNIIKGFI